MTKRKRFSQSFKNLVGARQGWSCAICKETFGCKIIYDHIKPLSLNGSNHFSNIQAICPTCDADKTYIDNMKYWSVQREQRTCKSKYFMDDSIYFNGWYETPPCLIAIRKRVKKSEDLQVSQSAIALSH